MDFGWTLPPGVSQKEIDSDMECTGHDYVKGLNGWYCSYCFEVGEPEND